jgi:hypothetical protein
MDFNLSRMIRIFHEELNQNNHLEIFLYFLNKFDKYYHLL